MRYQWGFCYLFIFIFKLNIFSLPILLQDKYNIGVLMVNIEFMWLGTKRMERFAKAHLSPVSKPRHIKFYIYRQYTNIVYILLQSYMYLSVSSFLFCMNIHACTCIIKEIIKIFFKLSLNVNVCAIL